MSLSSTSNYLSSRRTRRLRPNRAPKSGTLMRNPIQLITWKFGKGKLNLHTRMTQWFQWFGTPNEGTTSSPCPQFWNKDARVSFSETANLHINESIAEVVSNKDFVERLRAAKFDVIFTHMADFCPIGLQYAVRAPTWVWMSSGTLLDHMANLAGLSLPASYAARKSFFTFFCLLETRI